MKPFRPTSIPAQLAEHLKREVEEGRLEGVMPGVLRLERQTGVNRKTVEAALRILENDGLLEAQGAGKRRRIVVQEGTRAEKSMRVAILPYEPEDRQMHYIVDLAHQLAEAGHRAHYAARSMLELGMNLARIARLVEQTEADAWVVLSGPQREALGRILNSLFRHTSPTAMIIGDASLYFAVQQHLARLGIVAPDHVSLACTDANPSFEWCRPTIAHIAWDSHAVIRQVVKWADNISRGREDRRKTTSLARFVDGGSIGPAKGR